MARTRSAAYDDQREAILARAAELFAAHGYAGTSMNEVARACGLSKPALYHYFADKYALLLEIAESHVARLDTTLTGLAAELRGQPPALMLKALIERIVHEYAGAQDAHRVLTEDVRFLDETDRRRILDRQRRVVAAFADAVAAVRPDARETGAVKPLTMLLFGMVNWMFTWHRSDGALGHDVLAPLVADLFTAGVSVVQLPAVPERLADGGRIVPQPVPEPVMTAAGDKP
jgi:AcrR family transcriptional regulator